jgi:hypothetical protein
VSFLLRAILIVTLLAQPLMGLMQQRCVGMPDAKALASMGMPVDTECGCCGSGNEGGAAIECPMAKNGYAGCNCKNPQPEDPKTPPSDQKPRQVEHLFSTPPLVVAVLVPLSSPTPRWTATEPVDRSGSHSIQSLLCVWLM